MSGFVKTYRSVLDHPLFVGNLEYLGAWNWLIAKAAWKPHTFRHRNSLFNLQRGQLPGARAHLAKEWGWSEKKVRTFLRALEKEGMVTLTGQRLTVITISNYSKFQDIEEPKGQQRAIQKKEKKLKKRILR